MNDALKTLDAILQSAAAGPQLFARNSRYFGLPTRSLTGVDGRTVTYLGRRFVPPPDRFAPLRQHRVVQGDRLDSLAAQYFGDPELFWRLCDANNAVRPDELLETLGQLLLITLPEGIPSGSGGT
jgi:hypothetical protein